MKILSSTIDFEMSHQLEINRQQSEKLQTWGGLGEVREKENPGFVEKAPTDDSVRISPSARQLFKQLAEAARQKQPQTVAAANHEGIEIEISPEDQQKLMILEKLWEQLTGKKVSLQIVGGTIFQPGSDSHGAAPAEGQTQAPGFEYRYHQSYHERETMTFNADGVVKTEDNREIDFSVELNMSREFYQSLDITVQGGAPRLNDPLVINFDGEGVGLSPQKFTFDLDADGQEEQLAMLRPGNGFLALDGNNDGIINDGSELFGPRSGNGFQDLAAYDEDGNHWIDENDSVFDRLRIWSVDESGRSTLFALGQKDIGAIYLGHAETPFQLKDSQNQLNGVVRSSGVYLREQGGVGMIQQIDLVS